MPGARGLIVRLLIAAGHPGGPHIAPAVMERYTELVIDEAVAACREIEQRYPMASNQYGKPSHGDELIRLGRVVASNCTRAVLARFGIEEDDDASN